MTERMKAEIEQIIGNFENAEKAIEATFNEFNIATEAINSIEKNTLAGRNIVFEIVNCAYFKDYKRYDNSLLGIKNTLNRRFWQHIIDLSKIQEIMTQSEKHNLQRQIEAGMPRITSAEVEALIDDITGDMPKRIRTIAADTYEKLTEEENHRKPHKGKVAKKAIFFNYFDTRYGNLQDNYYADSKGKINNLETVFEYLDGREINLFTHGERIGQKLGRNEHNPICENDYFKIEIFKNGNLHINFKRLDLLDKFNELCKGK